MTCVQVCECVCKPFTSRLPPFLWLPATPPPLAPPPPPSRLWPPLSQFLSLCDLITPLLISFDRRRLIRGQHLDGSHSNRQDQIFWALKGGLRSRCGGAGEQWEFPRDWQLWWRDEQRPEWCYTATVFCLGVFFHAVCLCVCACVWVGVYVLPHFPWVRCPSHGPSGKGWSGGLFVWVKKSAGLATELFSNCTKQPQQWPQLINTFIRTIVFFFQ